MKPCQLGRFSLQSDDESIHGEYGHINTTYILMLQTVAATNSLY